MDMSAIQEAVEHLQSLVGGADVRDMAAKRGGKPPMGAPGASEECAECSAGTCANPEHMSDDDLAGLEG